MGECDPADGADEHAGEDRATAKAAQGDGVAEPLAQGEQEQGADRPPRRTVDQRRELSPDRRRGHTPTSRSVASTKTSTSTPIATPASGVRSSLRRSTIGCSRSASPLMHGSDDRGQEPDRDRPEELGAGRAPDRREIGHRERERPEPRPVVEPDVDERADAGGEQARHEHDAHQRAPDPDHFHEQERALRAGSRAGWRWRRSYRSPRGRRSPSPARRA